MGGDLLRIRTVREPRGEGSGRAGLASFLALVTSAFLLVPTSVVVLGVAGDGAVTGSQVWATVLLSATLAWVLGSWLVGRVDPDSSRGGRVATALVCAVFGTALGAFVLYLALLLSVPGDG